MRNIANLLPVLTALDPAELLLIEGELERWQAAPHDQTAVHALHAFCTSTGSTSELAGYHFETATGAKTVMDTLGVLNLQGFGFAHTHPALGPAGALVYYATENLCAKPENLRGLQEYRSARTLLLDPATLRNLEIFSSSRGTREGSLLHAINRTVTAAGARLLERWLAAPTLDLPEIQPPPDARRRTARRSRRASPTLREAARQRARHPAHSRPPAKPPAQSARARRRPRHARADSRICAPRSPASAPTLSSQRSALSSTSCPLCGNS